MRYSTSNITVSLTVSLATHLRGLGYDILWQATGTVEVNTIGMAPPRAEVTLVPEFPANPSTIVRLKTEQTGQDQIVVPALSMQVLGGPMRISHQGLGHSDYRWERDVRVDGLAANEFQQRELMDHLHDWLSSSEWKALLVSDYDTNPASPPVLDPVNVTSASTSKAELQHEVEAVRYYVRAEATVSYIE